MTLLSFRDILGVCTLGFEVVLECAYYWRNSSLTIVNILVWSSGKDTNIPLNVNILGQGSVAHGCVSNGTPEQMTPPFEGGGLVHAWLLCWVPVPHVTEQATHSVHAVHPPSTGIAM